MEKVIDGNAKKRKDRKQWKGIKNGWTDLLNRKRAGFGRIFGMEIGDNVGSMSKFIGGNQEVSSLVPSYPNHWTR